MARKQKSEKELVVSSSAAASAAPRRKAVTTRKKHSFTQAETSFTPVVERSSAQPVPSAATYEPTYEEISKLAYTYWEARGYQGGCPEEDWLRAEQELRAHVSTPTV
jgi:hypothetical protein